eukprot:evm.model.NODE_19521_length_34721_cov_28.145790.2
MLSFPLLCDRAEYESDDLALRVSKSRGSVITIISVTRNSSSSSTSSTSSSSSAIAVTLEELFRHEAELTIAA